MHILIIEDEEALSDLLGYILEEEGYAITIAHDYDEAIAHLDLDQFDIVMADMTIPGGNGIDLVDVASEKNPRSQYIVMSGYELSDDQRERIDSLRCHFLSKPFKINEVSNMIKNISEY